MGADTILSVSFWLEIAQQPVSGRRKTDKDRRPVAPTPIVRLWIREHRDTMTPGVLINPVLVPNYDPVTLVYLGWSLFGSGLQRHDAL